MDFDPDRYLGDNPAAAEKFAYIPFGAGGRGYILETFLTESDNMTITI